MKLTKFEHACFTVEHEGQVLVVDPGVWTTDFVVPENVLAVFISHEHPDHFSIDHVNAIIDQNPNALIISNQSIVDSIKDYKTQSVVAGETVLLRPFSLRFFGGQHAVIHPDIPAIPNLGIMINNLIYYPGDSFAVPDSRVDTLALPVAAPWLKFSEVVDFLAATRPRFVFPTHDAILNDTGKELIAHMASEFSKKTGSTYRRINGETINV